jgi:L1 cell adhesion molecule like protein
MKNENRTDDMVEILSYLHQYVPMQSEMTVVNVPEIEEREEIQFESLHHILIGGDQLTSERIRGAQSVRKNSVHAAGRLEGFIPVTEDWHAKVCYLQVMWKRFYKKGDSFTDRCTLPQLQSLINRTNVPLDPKKNVHAAEDFMEVILKGHVTAAALQSSIWKV